MTIPGGFVAGDVLGATDMNGLPAGVIGRASVTAAQNTIGLTVTDLTSLTVTWTAVSARLYRISFQVAFDINWSSGVIQPAVYITDDSNTVKQTVHAAEMTADANYVALSGFVLETSLSGSVTRKLRASANPVPESGNTVDMLAAATRPAYILVEDLGPA